MAEHDGHRERMRQRVRETDMRGFQPHEVLEFLLMYAIPRRDVNPLAHKLIKHFGSLSGVLDARPEELMQVPGDGENAAFRSISATAGGKGPASSAGRRRGSSARRSFRGRRWSPS